MRLNSYRDNYRKRVKIHPVQLGILEGRFWVARKVRGLASVFGVFGVAVYFAFFGTKLDSGFVAFCAFYDGWKIHFSKIRFQMLIPDSRSLGLLRVPERNRMVCVTPHYAGSGGGVRNDLGCIMQYFAVGRGRVRNDLT